MYFCLHYSYKHGRISCMIRTIIIGSLFLFGCSSYPFTIAIPAKAIIGEVTELYDGKTIGQTSGRIVLVGVSTGTQCLGTYKYTFVSPNGIGSTGVVNIQCNDGRTTRLFFLTETAEIGHGFGKDSKGAPAVFTFGKSDFETVEIYKRYIQTD